MKERKLAPLLALIICVEMIISPVMIHAQTNTNSKTNGVEMFSAALGVGQALLQQVNQNQVSPHMQGDMFAFQRQQTPITDKYFTAAKLTQIPGLGQYLALNNINPQMLECKTLPTTLHEAKNEACRLGTITSDTPPQSQLNEMFTYYNQYTQINKLYRNFTAESNTAGQLFGVGCMKNAMQILNGFFKYRMDELDKLTTNLEAINNQFKEASRADLDAIEESTAVLNGGDSELVSKVKTKNPDLFDYSKRFDNPACISMFSGNALNELGTGVGLNGIKKKMKEVLSTPGGKFSGQSYSENHMAVVDDISNLADKAAKQVELNFTSIAGGDSGIGSLLGSLRSLSSAQQMTQALTPDLFSDIQAGFQEKNNKLKAKITAVNQELGTDVSQMVQNINSQTFDTDVAAIENGMKNRCLSSSINMDQILGKIYDPTATKFANKTASNFLKDKLRQIMENSKTSPEKKLAELKSLETQEGSRYYLRMENSYEVQELDAKGSLTTRLVGASSRRTPSVYFSDIINNCEAQFKVNKLGTQMSGSAAITQLRNLKQEYKTLAKNQANDMKGQIKKRLIECQSSTDANSVVAGSCTPEKFNPSSAGFCANGALTCSKNMQSCTQQAEKYVSDIKTERTARVNNYKALAAKNKADIVKIFDTALSTYMKDGELLRATFGVGFSSPKDIQREINPESARYLDTFREASTDPTEGKLLLEDPEKYVAMFKKNIEALKKSIDDQQDQILGGGRGNSGILAEHIKLTEKNYDSIVSSSQQYADKCIATHDAFIKQNEAKKNQMAEAQQKKSMELGEKMVEFCSRYSLAQEHPVPACDGKMQDLFSAARAAGPQGTKAANDLAVVCKRYNNNSKSETSIDLDPEDMCKKIEETDPQNQVCKTWKVEKKYGTYDCYETYKTGVDRNGNPEFAKQKK